MVGMSVAISILCGVVSGVILYQNSYNSMVEEADIASKAYSQSVQNKIRQYTMSVEQIAMNYDIVNKSSSIAAATKDKLAKEYGFLAVSTADATGQSDVAGVNVSDRDYFKQAVSGKTYISSPVVSKKDKSVVLYVAAKMNNSDNNSGIVFAQLGVDTFSSMVDSATIGQTGYSFITDKTGTIIAHKDRAVVTNFTNYIEKAKKDSSISGLAGITQKMIAGKTGSETYSMNGSASYIAYCPISGTDGWSIGVTAKTSEMMSGFYFALYITFGLMLLFIILSWIIAFKVANPIVKPVVSLVKRIELLAEGDLHSEVLEVKTGDEIDTLSKSFSSTVNTLNSYVGEISTVLGSLASGDYTVETQQDYKGDFVEIKTALNTIIVNLNNMFTNINQSADQVASGAEQVASASQALSQGATEQASSIEELSASITEIADQVNKNATNAVTANKLSLESSAEVERGNAHMQNMVAAMTDISESSSQIGKIIKTIEDIAFQTNILALNAAVEAARAGAAGKGFAVVADEVRNLASKSAEAAKNTTAMIESSIKAVENGTKIANETASSLNAIIEGSKKTSDLISEISVASNDQATSINQVTMGVDQISAVVQTNSATSEESAATSEELSGQARILKDTLASLKLRAVQDTTQSSSVPAKKEGGESAPSNSVQEISKY
jgi:methyl-accepting chemotaxis protein